MVISEAKFRTVLNIDFLGRDKNWPIACHGSMSQTSESEHPSICICAVENFVSYGDSEGRLVQSVLPEARWVDSDRKVMIILYRIGSFRGHAFEMGCVSLTTGQELWRLTEFSDELRKILQSLRSEHSLLTPSPQIAYMQRVCDVHFGADDTARISVSTVLRTTCITSRPVSSVFTLWTSQVALRPCPACYDSATSKVVVERRNKAGMPVHARRHAYAGECQTRHFVRRAYALHKDHKRICEHS